MDQQSSFKAPSAKLHSVFKISRADLYIITPTYSRQTQLPDLVNIIQAMMVSNQKIVLLLVEDTSMNVDTTSKHGLY